ncbi:hypothetical protein CSHISOI_03181 [Colletotrichum shisoi]|uniref:LYR motif-containing protein Cup1-like N-terminal domain-containing protein n=1 Tax=Colletotrichum shisoi TaxID=2078593 RepID=A0A5Q4C0X5_9PEZI|nr:hypothetical protein CSHISOI_03181 [Colletotrichum shisoi]
MPHSRIPLPHPVQPLHVYRHLLRAATYYPVTIRPFLFETIQTRFREERQRAAERESQILGFPNPEQARKDEEYRRKKHLLDGKKRIPFLQAAANGDQKRLRKVMWHTFGRLGKRRRELVSLLVAKEPEPPLGPEQLQRRMEQVEKDRKKKEKLLKTHPWKRNWDREDPTPWVYQHLSPIEDNWDIPKLRAYIKAQQSHQRDAMGAAFPRTPFRNLDPMKKVPKEDIWGRPTAPRRVTKAVRKWWKWTADKIMPPIAEDAWDFLELLASGDAPKELYTFPPQRRIAVSIGTKPGETPSWDWTIHTRLPARDVERSRGRQLSLLTGQFDQGPYSKTAKRLPSVKRRSKSDAKITTPRKEPFRTREVRREYERMWQATSYVQPAPVKAGSGPSFARPVWGVKKANVPVATAAHHRLFEDVDAKGKRPKSATSYARMPKGRAAGDETAEAKGPRMDGRTLKG